METSKLDRNVWREATRLVARAEKLLAGARKLVDRAALEAGVARLRAALPGKDGVDVKRLAEMRALLPLVDGLVDAEMAAVPVSFLRELVDSIGVALVVALLLRLFVAEPFQIPSSSMIPTLEIGDYLFVNKLVYGPRVPFVDTRMFPLRSPKRGEVAVFVYPCDGRNFIKRIVAVAGDTVEMRCSRLYINGQAVPQQLVDGETCSFYDRDEYTGGECQSLANGWTKCPCSRYREQLDGIAFETNYDAGRPRLERVQPGADLGDDEGTYISRTSDFPQLPISPRATAMDAQFTCKEVRSNVEVVVKDRGVIGRFEPAAQPSADPCGPRYHYTVPPGYVFAMGDNRDHSNDSRFWGPVPVDAIKGKAMFVFWSKSDPAGLRLERFGQLVHGGVPSPSEHK